LRADFTTRLSGIILISEAMFGAGFDLEARADAALIKEADGRAIPINA